MTLHVLGLFQFLFIFGLVLTEQVFATEGQSQRQTEVSQLGCGPQKEKHKILKHDDLPMPDPSPPLGKALVFVARGGVFGSSDPYGLGINGRWVAVLDEKNYAFFEVAPGPLRICWVQSTKRIRVNTYPGMNNVFLLTAEEGKKYYLRGELISVHEMVEDDWKKFAWRFRRVTFETR